MDYKSVFANLCLELQQNRSWIKGLGKNPFTHSIPFTHSLTAVPFVLEHRSVFPWTRHPTFVTATSGVLTWLPAKLSKNGMLVYTLSDRRSTIFVCVYTASEAKGLTALPLHSMPEWPCDFIRAKQIMRFCKNFGVTPYQNCQLIPIGNPVGMN